MKRLVGKAKWMLTLGGVGRCAIILRRAGVFRKEELRVKKEDTEGWRLGNI